VGMVGYFVLVVWDLVVVLEVFSLDQNPKNL